MWWVVWVSFFQMGIRCHYQKSLQCSSRSFLSKEGFDSALLWANDGCSYTKERTLRLPDLHVLPGGRWESIRSWVERKQSRLLSNWHFFPRIFVCELAKPQDYCYRGKWAQRESKLMAPRTAASGAGMRCRLQLETKTSRCFQIDGGFWTICSDFYACSREYSNSHQAKQQMLKNSCPSWDIKPNMYLAVENKQSAVA